jgi:hypothetical protein
MKRVMFDRVDTNNDDEVTEFTMCKCDKCQCWAMVDLNLHPVCPYCTHFKENHRLHAEDIGLSDWYNFGQLEWR